MSQISDALDATDAPNAPDPARGVVASSHPLATAAALEALDAGGSAVDAAIAANAVLCVVDPMSTSLGGDCFALVCERGGSPVGLEGVGAAPKTATIAALTDAGHERVPERGPFSVTVPGALAGWDALVSRFGRRTLAHALEPAARVARDGFEVTPVVGRDWAKSVGFVAEDADLSQCPTAGERFAWPSLAATFDTLAQQGARALYEGPLAERIASAVGARGGLLQASDLAAMSPRFVEPLEVGYRGHPVHQMPPPSQGLVASEALRLLDEYPLGDLARGERVHLQVEALKLAFATSRANLGAATPADAWLDPARIERALDALDAARVEATTAPVAPPFPSGDTVCVSVVDREGMCCVVMNSTYMHFGSGIVVDGVVLQNRGTLFHLDPAHPGALRGGARPPHTLMPSMVFRSGLPWLCLGVVGGYQQPQAQVQILSALIDEGAELQPALDAPRFRWDRADTLRLEDGYDAEVSAALIARGHRIDASDSHGGFGGAQAILIEDGVVTGATDPRKDGVVGRQDEGATT